MWVWGIGGWKESRNWGSFVVKCTPGAYQNGLPRIGSGPHICDFRQRLNGQSDGESHDWHLSIATADWQLLPGNSQSNFPQAGWHSRHREGCWREPSHKPRELHSSSQPHGTASSARIPVVPPPRSLQKEKWWSSAMGAPRRGPRLPHSICNRYLHWVYPP